MKLAVFQREQQARGEYSQEAMGCSTARAVWCRACGAVRCGVRRDGSRVDETGLVGVGTKLQVTVALKPRLSDLGWRGMVLEGGSPRDEARPGYTALGIWGESHHIVILPSIFNNNNNDNVEQFATFRQYCTLCDN